MHAQPASQESLPTLRRTKPQEHVCRRRDSRANTRPGTTNRRTGKPTKSDGTTADAEPTSLVRQASPYRALYHRVPRSHFLLCPIVLESDL